MLTKGFIQEIIDPHTIKVRIPIYNKIEGVNGSTPNDELNVAAMCCIPNIVVDAHIGDVVIVGFEDNTVSKPVILGHLSTSTESKSLPNIKCENLTTTGDTKLGSYTSIGNVTPQNIKCLENQENNIRETFNILTDKISNLSEKVNKLCEMLKI